MTFWDWAARQDAATLAVGLVGIITTVCVGSVWIIREIKRKD